MCQRSRTPYLKQVETFPDGEVLLTIATGLVTTGDRVDVVVWRHPRETADEAIERYRRQHPTMPSATTTFHVVSWER